MAFRDIALGGAECGDNAMKSFVNHVNRDTTLHRESGRGESSSHPFGRQIPPNQLEAEFLAKNAQSGFNFHEVNEELDRIRAAQIEQGFAAPGENWADEFAHAMPPPSMMNDPRFEEIFHQARPGQNWEAEFHNMPSVPGAPQTFEDFERIYNERSNVSWADEFEEGDAQGGDWAQQFETAQKLMENEKEALAKSAAHFIESITDPKIQKTKFMEFMRQLRDGQVEIQDNKVVKINAPASNWEQEFEQAQPQNPQNLEEAWEKSKVTLQPLDWATEFVQQQQQNLGQVPKGLPWIDVEGNETNWEQEYTINSVEKEDWAKEFESSEQERYRELVATYQREGGAQQFESFEEWAEMYKKSIAPITEADPESQNWENIEKDWNKYYNSGWGYEGYNRELYSTYLFEENPYITTDNPYKEGIIASDHHHLADAILFFEAAVKQDPQNALAWERLGKAQAENEKDVHAIAALQKAVEIDSSRLDAWMSLAVSYANELCRPEAFNCLQSWLENHPRYSHIVQAAKPYLNQGNRHEEVVGLFINAARDAPGQDLDPDVQVALGVLFNISSEYDKSIDCFSAALHVQPNDYLLWNRLGATLAHSGRSEEAIEAYYKALHINPAYIRARYNLGISCINLDATKEAAEHFLTALSLQVRGENGNQIGGGRGDDGATKGQQMSKTIWDTLRTTFFMMQRMDLAKKCDTRNVNLFRDEFDFQ